MKQLAFIISFLTACLSANAQQLVLTRQQCRERALKHNEQISMDAIDTERAELDRKIAWVHYLPQVDGNALGLYTKDQDMMNMKLQMRGMYMAGLTVQEPLYVGGKITTGVKLAEVGIDVSRQQQRKTRMQVISDVDKAYFTLISVQQKIKMIEAYRRQLEEVNQQIDKSIEADLAIANDKVRVDAKLSEINYQLQKARNGETLCRLSLCDVMGEPLDREIIPADTTFHIAAPSAMDENVADRPEMEMLRLGIKAKELQMKMSRADMLPTVALAGGYSYYGGIKLKGAMQAADGNVYPFEQKMNGGIPMVGLVVKVPIFHWGIEQKKVKKAKMDVDRARLDYQHVGRQLGIEARQAVQNVTDGYNMVQTAVKGHAQADENLRVMRTKYDNGLAPLTDLLDAESQWQSSHSTLIEAQTQYMIYLTEYKRVTAKL